MDAIREAEACSDPADGLGVVHVSDAAGANGVPDVVESPWRLPDAHRWSGQSMAVGVCSRNAWWAQGMVIPNAADVSRGLNRSSWRTARPLARHAGCVRGGVGVLGSRGHADAPVGSSRVTG